MGALAGFAGSAWSPECSFYGPAPRETFYYDSAFQAEMSAPFGQTESLSIQGDFVRIAPIAHLSLVIGPSAVSGFIVPIVVDSVKSHPRRAWTHILKECSKAMKPAFAHGDSAQDVVCSTDVFPIGNSLFCLSPRSIFSAFAKTVDEVKLCPVFSQEASTTGGASSSEIASIDSLACSAFAETNPSSIPTKPWFRRSWRFNGESSKLHSNFYATVSSCHNTIIH